jgi:hypothetical protein
VDLLKDLISAGADVNVKDDNGKTPLILAANQGQGECVYPLIAANADLNAQDQAGQTALMVAAGLDRTRIIEALKAAGETK